jgi:hypothetical protein
VKNVIFQDQLLIAVNTCKTNAYDGSCAESEKVKVRMAGQSRAGGPAEFDKILPAFAFARFLGNHYIWYITQFSPKVLRSRCPCENGSGKKLIPNVDRRDSIVN